MKNRPKSIMPKINLQDFYLPYPLQFFLRLSFVALFVILGSRMIQFLVEKYCCCYRRAKWQWATIKAKVSECDNKLTQICTNLEALMLQHLNQKQTKHGRAQIPH